MLELQRLKDTHRPKKVVRRVGRGPGSKRGKTCCRGHKGDGSRSGYKRRYGYEGGGVPLFKRLPTRGFTRGRFAKQSLSINLWQIEKHYNDGEIVNAETLKAKGLLKRKMIAGIKILSKGELSKKVTIEADRFSQNALKVLEEKKISFKIIATTE